MNINNQLQIINNIPDNYELYRIIIFKMISSVNQKN